MTIPELPASHQRLLDRGSLAEIAIGFVLMPMGLFVIMVMLGEWPR